MYLADYHTHTRISPDAKRSMREMAEAAIEAFIQDVGKSGGIEGINRAMTEALLAQYPQEQVRNDG